MYVAVPLKEQGRIVAVVRASLPMTSIAQALQGPLLKTALGGLVIVLLLAALSLFISQRISRPLEDLKRGALRFAGGDLSRRLPVPGSDELGSLAEALNHMAEQLEDRINALIRQGQMQEAVLSSMVEGVLAVDADQRLITLNRAGARMLGRRLRGLPGPQHPGSGAGPAVAELHHPHHLCPGTRRRRGGRCTRASRLSRPTAPFSRIPTGRISASHRAARRHPLRRLEMTRRDFVANVSHELKTPITSIKGFVETLLAGALQEPENAENFLRIIARQTDRLNEIIDDLLSLSRIEQEPSRAGSF